MISPIAAQRRFVTSSLKTNRAMIVVATISKFPNRETLADELLRIPIIRKIGAAISRRIIPIT